MALSTLKKTALGALAAAASVAAPFNAMAGGFPPIFGASNVPGHFGMEVVRFVGDLGEPYMGNKIASLGRAAAHDWLKALEQEGPTATYRLVVTPRPEYQHDPKFANMVGVYGAVPSVAVWGPNIQLVVCVEKKIGSDEVLGTGVFSAFTGDLDTDSPHTQTTPRRIPGGCGAYFQKPEVLLVVNGTKVPPVAAKGAPRLAGY